MSESPEKKKYLCRAITRRTLDEAAADLEDTLNRLSDDGYQVAYETIPYHHLSVNHQYLVTGQLRDPNPRLPFSIINLRGQEGSDEDHRHTFSDEASTWFGEIIEKIGPPFTWDRVMEKMPPLLPDAMKKLNASQCESFSKEFDAAAAKHVETHKSETCQMPKVFQFLAEQLRSSIHQHLS